MKNPPRLPPSSSRTLQKRVSLDIKGLQHINPNQRVTCAVTDIPQAPPRIQQYSLTFLASLDPITSILNPSRNKQPQHSLCHLCSSPSSPSPSRLAPLAGLGVPPGVDKSLLLRRPLYPLATRTKLKTPKKKEKGRQTTNKPTAQPTINNKPLTKSQKTTPAPPLAVVVTTYLPTASPSWPPSSPARGYPPCPRRPCCSGDCCS